MTVVELNRRLSAAEFLQLEDSVGYELVNGRLVGRNVSRESSRIGVKVASLLFAAAEKSPGLVEVYGADLSYRCFAEDPEMLRRGDASVIRMSRLANVDKDAGTMPIPADLIIEVLSPNDISYRVSRKVRLYLDNGFRTVWVVDPAARNIAIHTNDAPGRVLREQDEIDVGDLIPTFRCKVADIFAGTPDVAPMDA